MIEGIVEVKVERLLRDVALMHVSLIAAHLLMAMECLRREINHIKAITIAVRVEVELIVAVFASQLGWVYGQSKPHASISHSHGKRSSAVGHHLGF